MKRTFLIVFFASMAATAFAQRPEFSLGVRYYFDDETSTAKTIYFGYDLTAKDSMNERDKWYGDLFLGGEQEYPDPFQDNDVRFGRRYLPRPEISSGGPIDIRKKPDTSAFVLDYEFVITTTQGTQKLMLTWDKSLIPPIIRHIYIEPEKIPPGPGRRRTDMTQTSQLEIPNADTLDNYEYTLVSIYYNTEERSTVRSANTLDRSVSIYPNPIVESSTIGIFLEKPSDVRLSITDMAGRKIKEIEAGRLSGLSSIPLSSSLFPASGAYIVRIDAAGMSTGRLVQIFK